MSIRFRLVVICLLIALLPAIPVSMLVQQLLSKSFDVGLNSTVESALQSGISISREHLEGLERDFSTDVEKIASAGKWMPGAVDHSVFDLTLTVSTDGGDLADLPPGSFGGRLAPMRPFAAHELFRELTSGLMLEPGDESAVDCAFFWSTDRSLQLAVWEPGDDQPTVLFARRTSAEFLAEASRVLSGRRIFAQLRLAQSVLGKSFFYPFIIVYGVIVLIALGLALFMSERMSSPVRQLADASARVADGDWDVRLDVRAGGEMGRLVAEFNEMVARLEDQRNRLVDMEKLAAWRDIARHLAHEIKNPLLPIRLTVEELRDQYGEDDERYREILQQSTRIVGNEIDRLSNLVREFSEFARMPALTPSRGRLNELAKDVSALYPKLNTAINVDGDVPKSTFDHDAIRRVLLNLYDNTSSVLDEREEAGDTVNRDVSIDIGCDGESIQLLFADRGPGIPGDVLPRIFDPYFTARKGGSGLGLAMVKSIVLLHGGSIEAQSVKNEGATFTVRLPMAGPPTGAYAAAGKDEE